jgi:C_GCAxxG_C_C family probable redox protein
VKDKELQEDGLDRVEKKAGDYMENGKGNCAQGAFFALKEEFNLGDDMIIKALDAMPGIGFRGDTCGAVIGALAALSVSPARMRQENPGFDSHIKLMKAATDFCKAFEKEFGSLMCNHIHTQLLGKTYDMTDLQQIQELTESGAPEKCRAPTGKAARFAAKIILEEES